LTGDFCRVRDGSNQSAIGFHNLGNPRSDLSTVAPVNRILAYTLNSDMSYFTLVNPKLALVPLPSYLLFFRYSYPLSLCKSFLFADFTAFCCPAIFIKFKITVGNFITLYSTVILMLSIYVGTSDILPHLYEYEYSIYSNVRNRCLRQLNEYNSYYMDSQLLVYKGRHHHNSFKIQPQSWTTIS
jgi:hypothetical protein